MPGAGRPADPLWTAIGFLLGAIPWFCFRQPGAGLATGIAVGAAFGLIREDIRRGHRRPADPLWFLFGFAIGMLAGISLHHWGLTWGMSAGLGIALGLVFGAVLGTMRADIRQKRAQENRWIP